MKITINDNMMPSNRTGCLMRLLLLSIAVIVGAWLLPGVEVTTLWAVLVTAAVIAVLNMLVRPLLVIITLPITAVTFGLFLFIINAIIIMLASEIVKGFTVEGFGSALLFSLVLTGVNYLLELPQRLMERRNKDNNDINGSHPYHDDDTDEDGFTKYEEIKD